MFPGQGSVYVGMGKQLCEKHEIARRTFEEASDAISLDLKKLCFSGELGELTKTENAQPTILTTSVAAYRVLQATTGFRPHYMAGHSLGEFTALTCANAVDLTDAVRLVRKRGELMRDAAGGEAGLMTAVGKLPKERILAICAEISKPGCVVCVSNYNSPKQTVISGHKDAVIAAENRLAAMGAAVKRLNVSAPFHSPLMQPAFTEFVEALKECSFRSPECAVLSNVTAVPHTEATLAENLAKQLISPVRWQESMEFLKQERIRLAVDVGPGKVLKNLALSNFPSVKALAYDLPDDAIELEKLLDNDKPVPFISRCMGLAVATRNLCEDESIYEERVVAPYRRLQAMQETVEAEERTASMEEMLRAKELLLQIFEAKRIPAEEQESRLQRLYTDTETEHVFRN